MWSRASCPEADRCMELPCSPESTFLCLPLCGFSDWEPTCRWHDLHGSSLPAPLRLYQEWEEGGKLQNNCTLLLFLWSWCSHCCVSSRPSSSISSQTPLKSNILQALPVTDPPQSRCRQRSVTKMTIHQSAEGLLLVMGGKISTWLLRHCYCP